MADPPLIDSPTDPGADALTDDDLYLFNEGTHYQLYDKLGAHLVAAVTDDGRDGRDGSSRAARPGARFALWAPNARSVSVIGDFNGWDAAAHPMARRGGSGVWEAFAEDARRGQRYKYAVRQADGRLVLKADPYGLRHEIPPKTASVLWDLRYEWSDDAWIAQRAARNSLTGPIAIYEVHLGSWRRRGDRWASYRELAEPLADHALRLGFTHVELMPVMEHPFYGSWGYQVTGYFAPTSRHGAPQDLMYLIDHLHQRGLGVILDWVPAHFPNDEYALSRFDGTYLYEHADPRRGFHPDWKSLIFNYGRRQVSAFLISSARLWLDRYHADALRVDGVASMLYLDYSRKPGEWIPNDDGSNENREAIAFLRRLNDEVARAHPDALMIAEESTAWPNVSRPVADGGLGFSLKWDMGWMHDSLKYFACDPLYRRHHHRHVTFRAMYHYSERFVLPLSHDEVVHGKGSLYDKMPGDRWRKLANLRLLLGYMYAQPGKKLLFMGVELAQRGDWSHEAALPWQAADAGAGVAAWIADLGALYRATPALHHRDVIAGGFEWIRHDDHERSVVSFLRKGEPGTPPVLAVFNFTPVPRSEYRIGVPLPGRWRELVNSDAEVYGGSGQGNMGGVDAEDIAWDGHPWSLAVHVPPLACTLFGAAAPLEPVAGAEPDGDGNDRTVRPSDSGEEAGS